MYSHLVNRKNIRMIQRGCRTRLLLEPVQPFRFCRRQSRQNLDGNIPIQARVAGAIYLAHAASPYQRDNLVVINHLSWQERHCEIISPFP